MFKDGDTDATDIVGGQTFTAEGTPVNGDGPNLLWPGRGHNSLAAAGGLGIPIAAYHHNHNIGSHL